MIFKTSRKAIVLSLLTLVSLELAGWQIGNIYWLVAIVEVFLLASAWLSLSGKKPSYRLMSGLIPAVNFLAWAGFLTIVNGQIIRQVLIISAAILQFCYWHRGRIAWFENQDSSWWRLVNAINLISVWLIAASLYGWQSFLAWPIFWPWLIWLLLSAIMLWLDYRVSELLLNDHWPMVLANWFVGGQLFLAIYFLPSSNLIQGYLLLVGYYLTSQVGRTSLLKINTVKRLRYQFLIIIISLILVLSTAKWF